MHGDYPALCVTLALIGLSVGGAWILPVSSEVKRKIIHIGVSNFGLIYLLMFQDDPIPLIGLVAFSIINFFILIYQNSERPGTVLFPLTICFLISLKNLGYGTKEAVCAATLCLGYADGLANLVGQAWGKKRLLRFFKSPHGHRHHKRKTVLGTLTAFVCILLIVFSVYYVLEGFSTRLLVISLLCAVLGCLAEAYTPFGLDNVTLPLAVYVLCSLL